MHRRLGSELVEKKDLLLHALALEHISGGRVVQPVRPIAVNMLCFSLCRIPHRSASCWEGGMNQRFCSKHQRSMHSRR